MMDDESRNHVAGCVFCKIISSNECNEKDKIKFENENFFVIEDIKPASDHHFLVISKTHIKNVTEINDLSYIEEMKSLAESMMYKLGCSSENTRFGFHWPPFHSVDHLHLHMISPVNKMGFLARIIFLPNSWWFVSPEYVTNKLKQSKS